MSKVAVLKTNPRTVLDDYGKLMDLADYKKALPKDKDLLLKLNLSWSLYYPACSTEPWQLEGVVAKLREDGYKEIIPVENKTVVTNPWKGAKQNLWLRVLKRYGLWYKPLTEVNWVSYKPKHEMLALDKIYPSGHRIPEMFIGKSVLHFPTMKCVHPETEIFLADGSLVKIKDVVEKVHKKRPVEITADYDECAEFIEPIISLKDDAKFDASLSFRFWKTPIYEDIIEIKTKTGKEVKTSKIHPFLTPDGWKSASQLEKRERIAIPRKIRVKTTSQKLPSIKSLNHNKINLKKIKFRKGKKYSVDEQKEIIKLYIKGNTTTALVNKYKTHYESIRSILKRYGVDIRWAKVWAKVPEFTSEEFWRWYGYFIAEGYANDAKGTMRFWWSNGDKNIVEDFLALTKNLFGIKPKLKKDNREHKIYYFDSNHLKKFFEDFGVNFPMFSYNKSIPSALFKCPDNEIAAFLSGYLDGDGTCAKDGLHVTTKSEELAKKLQLLLLRIGSISFKKETYCMATNGKMKTKELYHKVSVYGDELFNLSKHITFLSQYKQKKLKFLVNRRVKSKLPSNWDTIPVNKEVFRSIRVGLGFTQDSTDKRSSVNTIENGYGSPTKHTLRYFIDLFEKADKDKRFGEEILYLKFLASEDIAWDYIEEIEEKASETDFLYDLSVFGTSNFVGNGVVLHNTHGHTITTGAMKNSFGGLITERRHHCHRAIHEVLVDLLQIQKEVHPGIFAVMDGTVAGNGAGPRTMWPRIANLILASEDQVAIDAVSARIMGFDPMKIPYIKIAHDMGLGCGDVRQIDMVGDDVSNVNLNFSTGKSPVIFFDQLFRKKIKFIEPWLFHTGLFKLCILGSEWYHDKLWYPIIGRGRINNFMKTDWGKLWKKYKKA